MNLLSKYIDNRIESLNDHGINFQEIENTSRDNYREDLMDKTDSIKILLS